LLVDRLGIVSDRLLGRSIVESEREDVEVFGATGAMGLFRRRMLDELGGLDESFFAFLEDGDLAWRARMAGWRAVYAPRAISYHHHSATAVHGSGAKHYLVGRNRVRLVAKNASRPHLLRYASAMIAYDLCYVSFAAVAHRTLAPLRGRVRGLSEWRRYRRLGAPSRRPVSLPPSPGLLGALRRHRTWAASSSSAHG
jgi:GT2 family glycosyltransferase